MSYILFIYHQYKHDISCNARMYTIISLIMILVDLIHSTTYFNSLVVNAYDISCNARIHTHFSDLNSPQQLFNSILQKVMENFITWHNITPQDTDSLKQDWISGWKKVGKFYTITILYKRVQNPTYFSEWTAPVIIGYISYCSIYIFIIYTHTS